LKTGLIFENKHTMGIVQYLQNL